MIEQEELASLAFNAVLNGDLARLKRVLELGLSLHYEYLTSGPMGYDLFTTAEQHEYEDIVEYLKECGYDFDAQFI